MKILKVMNLKSIEIMKIIKSVFLLFLLIEVNSVTAQEYDRPRLPIPNYNPITNCQLRYYYYPNIQAYFDTQKNIYYLRENGEWKIADDIPSGYMGYSIYNKTNLIIEDYDDDLILQFFTIHKKMYPYTTKTKLKQITSTD